MKCPFELPVKRVKGSVQESLSQEFYTIEDSILIIGQGMTKEQADYIVLCINSHEKLANACEKARWLYDELALSTLGAACKYGDNYEPPTKEDCLNIRELLDEVLKGAEKK